jgi:hypothetical protein
VGGVLLGEVIVRPVTYQAHQVHSAVYVLSEDQHQATPKIIAVTYELTVHTDESDQRLDLLHTNVRKYGTISNTVAEATHLEGVIKRKV